MSLLLAVGDGLNRLNHKLISAEVLNRVLSVNDRPGQGVVLPVAKWPATRDASGPSHWCCSLSS